LKPLISDGTRFKVVYDSETAYGHHSVNGYEVKEIKNSMIRYRYPVVAPTGVVTYKEIYLRSFKGF